MKITGIKQPSIILYMIDSKKTVSGSEGWPVQYSGNTWPFTATADTSIGADFRHSNSANALYADMHNGTVKTSDLLGTSSQYIYEF
jgi:prepilin-type processing-associated H-X9-DG protein